MENPETDLITQRAAIIAKTLLSVSETSEVFQLALSPLSDDISVIFTGMILPEEINRVCQMLEDSGFTKYVVDDNVVLQSFLDNLVMAAIRVNTKKNTITLTFNT